MSEFETPAAAAIVESSPAPVWAEDMTAEAKLRIIQRILQDDDGQTACIQGFMNDFPKYDEIVEKHVYRTNQPNKHFFHVVNHIYANDRYINKFCTIEGELGKDCVAPQKKAPCHYGISDVQIEGNWRELQIIIGGTVVERIHKYSFPNPKNIGMLGLTFSGCNNESRYLPFPSQYEVRFSIETDESQVLTADNQCVLSYNVVRDDKPTPPSYKTNLEHSDRIFTIPQEQSLCYLAKLYNGIGNVKLLFIHPIDAIIFKASTSPADPSINYATLGNVRMKRVWLELFGATIPFVRRESADSASCDTWELAIPGTLNFSKIQTCKLCFEPEDATIETDITTFTNAHSYNLLKYENGCANPVYTF